MAPQTLLPVHLTTKQKIQAIKKSGNEVPATLTEADLKKHLPQKAAEAPSSGEDSYTCVTQRNHPQSSPAAIMVGLGEQIPRWKFGSVINFATYAEGYPAPGDAIYAAKALIEAAEIWNAGRVGVTFQWVSKVEDAAFVLAYGGELSTVLASAFFPSSHDLKTMWVYQHGFDKTERTSKRGTFSNYGIMKNVFLHELGHVLGLRHEFAMKPGTFEGGAISMGSANDESVMSYIFPPEMQESDVKDTRSFYNHPLIVDYTPDN
jgi:hypothetical protein